MPEGVTKKHRLSFSRQTGARRVVKEAIEKESMDLTPGRLLRVTRLMALAIRFEHLLATGAVGDQTEIAELGHVTRARVTQIMNLLHLAPDIQESILDLPRVTAGRAPIAERHIRHIAAEPDWARQRRFWRQIASRIKA